MPGPFSLFSRRSAPSVDDRRGVQQYFIRSHPLIARAMATRKGWLTELGRVALQVQNNRVPAAMRDAADTSRIYTRLYAELRDTLQKVEPPVDAATCHGHLMAIVEHLARANAALGAMAPHNAPRQLGEARLAMRDAREAVTAYNQARQLVRERYHLPGVGAA